VSAWSTVGGHLRRVAILIVGSVVLLAGIAMLALPGPGMVVIIVGLVILAQEFTWAERLLDLAVEKVAAANVRAQESKHGKRMLAASGVGLMITGAVVIVVLSQYWYVGVSLVGAGIIGLCTLLPKVSEWVEERAATGINSTDDVPLHKD
jgi:uncharacterized protein (TIGR02611 family)